MNILQAYTLSNNSYKNKLTELRRKLINKQYSIPILLIHANFDDMIGP